MAKTLLIILIYSSILSIAYAQDCPSLTGGTVPVSGNLGYQSRGGGHHCEGLVTLTNSAGVDLDIVSFTKGPVNFMTTKTEVLTIKSLLPSSAPQSVHGINFNMYRHYRLDVDFNGKDTVQIPAAPVISEIRIPKENLGLYGYTKVGRTIFYNPVKVTPYKGLPSRDSAYRIALLKNVAFDAMEYRLAPYENNKAGALGEPVTVDPTKIKGDRVSLDLRPGLKKGHYLMVVYYRLNNNYQNSANFYLNLP